MGRQGKSSNHLDNRYGVGTTYFKNIKRKKTLRNFEVLYDKFNVYRNCTYLTGPKFFPCQKQNNSSSRKISVEQKPMQ